MQVQSLGQEDPLEKSMATHSSIFARKISFLPENLPYGATVHGITNSQTQMKQLSLHTHTDNTLLNQIFFQVIVCSSGEFSLAWLFFFLV